MTSDPTSHDTACGSLTLRSSGSNSDNTALGFEALFFAPDRQREHRALGYEALESDVDGADNTASGFIALAGNTSGSSNTASGVRALLENTSGSDNTAAGAFALEENTTGNGNTAAGSGALNGNFTGSNNVAVGYEAGSRSGGSNNITVGYQAGFATSGSNNIDIGNEGATTDSGAMRIGTPGSQKEVFIAGIHSSKITGSAVFVSTSGRLGVLASSERYKTGIASMGTNSTKSRRCGQLPSRLERSGRRAAVRFDCRGSRQRILVFVTRDEKGPGGWRALR